jgi:APA family basic amino acid/polyamine antiporter
VHRTPVLGLVAQAVWAMFLCLTGTYGQLLDYVIFAALIFYLLTAVALFNFRRTQPDLPRPVKAFGYPVVPALYILANAFLLVVLLVDPAKRKFSAFGLVIVALGLPVYYLWHRRGHGGLDAP